MSRVSAIFFRCSARYISFGAQFLNSEKHESTGLITVITSVNDDDDDDDNNNNNNNNMMTIMMITIIIIIIIYRQEWYH